MRRYKIAVIPGDGVGREVIAAGLQVLEAVQITAGDLRLEVETFPWGSSFYRAHGRMMPADALTRLKGFDAIYFGAVGDPSVPDHVTLWELRLAICQGLDQYANVRPARLLPGIEGPLRGENALDCVIVRENTEGEYSGHGGRSHRGLPEEVATEVAVFTRAGIVRIMRFAYGLARTRPRRHLTIVTKSNAQRHGMVMWDEIAREVSLEFPDVTVRFELVDAMAARLVLRPDTVDVAVATNLHADILSDLAAALAGGLGIGATANLDPERRYPSMFEPIHGSAFDIAGTGVANPLGAIWSAAMMLDHLGEGEAGRSLMAAIEQVTTNRTVRTPDLGGTATTKAVTEAVCSALRATG